MCILLAPTHKTSSTPQSLSSRHVQQAWPVGMDKHESQDKLQGGSRLTGHPFASEDGFHDGDDVE